MTITTHTTTVQRETVTLLQDYTAALTHAYDTGDTDRQARIIATLKQALHIAGLHLDHVCADITHSNGRYVGGDSLNG